MPNKQKPKAIFTIACFFTISLFLISCNQDISKDIRFDKKGSVDKVIITSSSSSLVIEHQNQEWYCQEQKVLTIRMEALLGALSQLQIYAPVSKSNYKAYSDSLDKLGTKIQVIKKWHKNYSATFINLNGKNVMQLHNDENIYIIEARGFPELNLSPYYTFSTSWLENYLFTQPTETIQKLTIQYPDSTNNFTLQKDSTNKLILIIGKNERIAFDTSEATFYLAFYEAVHYTSEENIKNNTVAPYFKLTINYDDQDICIDAYRLKTDTEISKSYFAASINNEKWVKLHYLDFDALLVTPEYFQQNTN